MTRDQAIDRARADWGEGEPQWILDLDATRVVEPGELSMIYSPPTNPVWYIPMRAESDSRVGSARALIVDTVTGYVRKIRIAE